LPFNPQDARVAELEEENLKLRVELKAAEVRRELAVNLPRLANPADRPGKKTPPSTTQHLRRKLRKRSRRQKNNTSR
jgi:hypothetical protein